ncbi:MAG TPA: DUF362 domain-containing protein [Chthonomonadaceae bacterium]|nr:DUF362 domain-containing protein [Chthonomonadaceae bacterium]
MAESNKKITRRKVFEIAAGAVVLGGLYGLTYVDENAMAKPRIRPGTRPNGLDLAVCEGTPHDYAAITERAINEFGGIEKFVKKGDRVVLSPNMGWMRTPEQAAATHPDVLRKVVQLCEQAGASKITCIDYTLDDWKLAFDICGAKEAVRGTRATLLSPTEEEMYQSVHIPDFVPKSATDGSPYDGVHDNNRIYQKLPREILECDAFICIPIVKDHEAATITISMKKLMGNIWNRKDYHRYGLHDCIAELNMALRPTLIIADATRALQTRGPKGPGEVTVPNKVVVGIDPVAVDSYCTRFLTVKGVTPDAVRHLVLANQLGRGELDCDKLKIKELAGPRAA